MPVCILEEVMYVITRGKGDKTKVYLIESYWNKEKKSCQKRIIKYFGLLKNLSKDDPDFLSKLKAQYSKLSDQKKTDRINKQIAVASEFLTKTSQITDSSFQAPSPVFNYANLILRFIWQKLGLHSKILNLQYYHYPYLKFNINEVASNLCFLKILNPGSIKRSYCHRSSLFGSPFEDISLDQLYSVLNFFSNHKTGLLQQVNKVLDKKFNRNYSMVFYDVTNVFFETDLTDEECDRLRNYDPNAFSDILNSAIAAGDLTKEQVKEISDQEVVNLNTLPKNVATKLRALMFLRTRGLSKEHRYDLPLISISLIIDDNAIPIDFQIYSGCASEYKTMANSIEEMKKKYNVKNTIVVADRGINSAENMQMLLNHGYGFLVAQKISNLGPKLTETMLNNDGYDERIILKDENKPATEDNIEDIIKHKTVDYIKKDQKGNCVPCKLVFLFSLKRQKRDLKDIEDNVKIAENAVINKEDISFSKRAWIGYVDIPKENKPKATKIKQDLIDKKKKLAGYYGIIYHSAPNQEDAPFSEQTLLSAYHNLVQIEECFRIMKTNFQLRPMYVRLDDRIHGHVTCFVLALILLRLLQIKLKEQGVYMSLNEIKIALNNAKLVLMNNLSKDEVFVSVSEYEDLYYNREKLSKKKMMEIAKNYEAPLHKIIKALGLIPLPGISNREIIDRCFNIKLKTDRPMVDSVLKSIVSN